MRHLIPSLMLLVACGDGSSDPDASTTVDAARADAARADAMIDAGSLADLSCLGQPPDPGPGPVTIRGTVFAVENYDITPVPNAQVVVRRRSNGALVGSATTDADGKFEIPAPEPVIATFTVNAAGYPRTRAVSDVPVPAADDALLLVANNAELARWYADAGAPAFTPGDRTAIVSLRDCAFDPLAGATVEVTPAPGTIAYYDEPAKRWSPTLSATTNGFALAAQAAPSLTVTPRVGATTLPAEEVDVDGLTLAVITPHD